MGKAITEEQARRALERYRSEKDLLVTAIRYQLPNGVTNVATISNHFAFIDSVTSDKGESRIQIGQVDEPFFMCKEFFEYAKGKLPDKRLLSQYSIDMILNVEKNPFIVISLDRESTEYFQNRTLIVQSGLDIGEVRRTQKTTALLYDHIQILPNYNSLLTKLDDSQFSYQLVKLDSAEAKKIGNEIPRFFKGYY